jgi:hypothetical protein
MLSRRRVLGAVLLAAGLFCHTESSHGAVVMTASPTHVAGFVYRYDISLSEFVTGAGTGFTLYFPLANVVALSNPVASGDWDVLVFDPDSPPGANGAYDALALVNTPSLTGFSVDATLTGGTPPLGLTFEIYQLSPFLILETGTTLPAAGAEIPEPATTTLTGLALLAAGLPLWRRRQR